MLLRSYYEDNSLNIHAFKWFKKKIKTTFNENSFDTINNNLVKKLFTRQGFMPIQIKKDVTAQKIHSFLTGRIKNRIYPDITD